MVKSFNSVENWLFYSNIHGSPYFWDTLYKDQGQKDCGIEKLTWSFRETLNLAITFWIDLNSVFTFPIAPSPLINALNTNPTVQQCQDRGTYHYFKLQTRGGRYQDGIAYSGYVKIGHSQHQCKIRGYLCPWYIAVSYQP